MRLRVLEPHSAAFMAFEALLAEAALPTDDLLEGGARYYALGGDEHEAFAFAGLEAFGTDALVRSVVVPSHGRGTGLGGRIVQALAELAAAYGVERLWLLTTDAEAFFALHGFAAVDRPDVPAAIAATAQFQTLCPTSAVVMCRTLP
jgi:N-acetylglutamate synthase-like GNAT family acetyltransferase